MLRRVALFAVVPMAIVVSSCSLNTAEPATYVTDVSATLNGLVTSNEQPGEVTYWFNYGTTTDYGTTTPDRTIQIPAGAEDDVKYPVSEPIQGLEPNTTYHYQACSSPGIDPGSRGCTNLDQTFTTGAAGSGRSGIAFDSERDLVGRREVWVMDASGANQTRLTNSPGLDAEPSWSPDGGRLAFTSSLDNPFFEIYSMNADGTGRTRLTSNTVEDRHPSWSPDGETIAFTSRLAGNAEIYAMDAGGGNLVNLTQDIFGDFEPSWSPDGSRITFYATRNEHADNYEIYSMKADGSGQTRLTDNAADDVFPAWSPDGRKIAFVSLRDGNYEVYVMNADGSNAVRLTNDSDGDYSPDWSPDGTKLAWISGRAGADDVYDEVWVMNANGADKTRLTNAGNNAAPDWSPRP